MNGFRDTRKGANESKAKYGRKAKLFDTRCENGGKFFIHQIREKRQNYGAVFAEKGNYHGPCNDRKTGDFLSRLLR